MKRFFPRLLLGFLLVFLTMTAVTANPRAAAAQQPPQLSQIDHDVAQSLLNVRLAMRDIAECNIYMLGRIARILAQEKYNLMRLQGWTFGKLQEMGQNLNDILSQMESLMEGPPSEAQAALEGLKTGLGAAGLIPGFGVIAYGASLTVQAGEIYAKVHNSSQAANIAEGIKKNAQEQIEAFQGAVDLYNDIVTGLAEIDGFQARIQQLLDTYEERCLKKGDTADTGPHTFVPSEGGAPVSDIGGNVDNAMKDYDPCDLRRLIALNALLTAELNTLEARQEKLFNDLLNKNNELSTALHNLEQGLPQPPNWGWEGANALIGLIGGRSASTTAQSVTSFALGTTSQLAGIKKTLDGLEGNAALKKAVQDKLAELEALVREQAEVIKEIIRLQAIQKRVQTDIETWEQRCTKQEDGTTGRIGDDAGGILIGSDGTEWCTYGFGGPTVVPVTPEGGGTIVPGGTPTSAPPGTPDGGTPSGPSTPPSVPVTPTGTEDPGKPQDGGGPVTLAPPPPPPVIPVGPTGTKPPPTEDPTDTGGPQLIVKAKQSVLQKGAGKAVAGQQIKLFAASTVNQALPNTKGAVKNDVDFKGKPLQCTTGKDGKCAIPLPAGTLKGKSPNLEANVNVTQQSSVNVEVKSPANGKPAASQLPAGVQQYATDTQSIGGKTYVTLTYPSGQDKKVRGLLKGADNVVSVETNYCRDKQPGPVIFGTLGGLPAQHISLGEVSQ